MKKIVLSMAALFAFGIASAQTDPVPEPQPAPVDPATKMEVKMQPDVVHKKDIKDDGTQSRKDKIITQEHVKSTPDPSIAKETPKKAVRKAKAKKTVKS